MNYIPSSNIQNAFESLLLSQEVSRGPPTFRADNARNSRNASVNNTFSPFLGSRAPQIDTYFSRSIPAPRSVPIPSVVASVGQNLRTQSQTTLRQPEFVPINFDVPPHPLNMLRYTPPSPAERFIELTEDISNETFKTSMSMSISPLVGPPPITPMQEPPKNDESSTQVVPKKR